MNDDDDDELSKKAFHTLVQLDIRCVDEIMRAIETSVGAMHEAITGGRIGEEVEQGITMLSKYLPVLNGLICECSTYTYRQSRDMACTGLGDV